MSNYTKSFNFRNGVQVDDKSLVVNANGLVGIGTTRPEKRLDVFGNARVSGISSLSSLIVTEVVTIGAGITLDATSGVITATKFVGDASGLQNIVAIATDGWLANAGTLSTVGNVGIGTTIFTNTFEVKGFSKLVGLTTFEGSVTSQNINSSGIITSTKFVGVSGAAAPFDNINVGTAATVGILTVNNTSRFNDEVRIPDSINLKFGTFDDDFMTIAHEPDHNVIRSYAPDSAPNKYLYVQGNNRVIISNTAADVESAVFNVGAGVTLKYNNLTRFETTGTGVTVTGNLGVSDRTFMKDLEVSGVSTFRGTMELQAVSVGQTVGFGSTAYFPDDEAIMLGDSEDLKIYHGLSNPGSGSKHSYIQDSGTGDLVILSNEVAIRNATETEDLARFKQDEGVKLYYNGVEKIETIGAGVSVYGQLTVARLNGGTNQLSTRYGGLRYGNESGNFAFSTRKSLDLLNYDTGNINFYLDGSNINSGIGSFVWHRGSSNALMALNAEGSLGIGLTIPEFKLDVDGTARISGLTSFSDGINVTGGNITVTNSVKSKSGNFEFDLSTGSINATFLNGNVNAQNATGTSIFKNLIVQNLGTGTGVATISELQTGAIGINTSIVHSSNADNYLTIGNLGSVNQKVFITNSGEIGIRTSLIPSGGNIGINARDTTALVKAIGVGTTGFNQGSAADFSNAGEAARSRYMVPPIVQTDEERALLRGAPAPFNGNIQGGYNQITVTSGIANITVGTVVTTDSITNSGGSVSPIVGVAVVSQILTGPDRVLLKQLDGVTDANFGGTGNATGSFNNTGSNNTIPIGSIIFDRTTNTLKYFDGNVGASNGGWSNV